MKDAYLLKYPPAGWEEGMLLGNGTLGAVNGDGQGNPYPQP